MSIWGKIIGGAAGLALGGPLGALVGVLAGHMIGRRLADGRAALADSGDGADSGDAGAATRRVAFTVAVIALGAKLAKADGVVTRDEIAAFREVFNVPPGELRKVAGFFDQARRHAGGYEPYARQVAGMFADEPAVLEELLGCLFHIAGADGRLSREEDDYLRNVARIFGFSDDDYGSIRAAHAPAEAADPWQILGVARDAGDGEIRSAYRRLVRENHPDRLIAAGMPEDFIAVATEKLARINNAYEQVRGRGRPG